MPTPNVAVVKPILVLYLAVIVIGSLYPFWGWRGLSAWSLDFLLATPPRFITRNDVSTNLLAYLPLGYLVALYWFRPRRRVLPILLAWCLGSAMSVGLEGMQQLLPGRIASNLDVFLNSLGALIGALLALHHSRWLRAWTALRRWRQAWFKPHGRATLGLWLLLAWGVTQFALLPQPGIGWLELHLRPFDMPPDGIQQINLPWLAAIFLEMAALGVFAACLLRPGHYASAMFLLFVSAFGMKLLMAAMLLKLKVMGGILSLETIAAFVLALWLLLLPSVSRHRKAVAVVLLSLIAFGRLLFVPDPLWPSGSLLNLVGLSRHLAAIWPWLALVYLLWLFGREAR